MKEPKARNNDQYMQSEQTQTDKTSSTANSIITAHLKNFRSKSAATIMTSHTDRKQLAIQTNRGITLPSRNFSDSSQWQP